MISNRYRCIYIHQRKTAGASIISSFQYKPQQSNWDMFNDGTLSPEWKEFAHKRQHYFIFSSVRNPFDRLISGWLYLSSTRQRSLQEVLENPPQTGHDYRHLTRQQIEILCEKGSKKLVVQELIRYENLQADYDRICEQIGKPLTTLPNFNSGNRQRDYRGYFNPTTRRLAEELFADDLHLLNYEF